MPADDHLTPSLRDVYAGYIRMSKLPELTPGIMRLRFIILILFVAVVLLFVLFLSFLFSEIARECSTPFEVF